MWRVTFRPSRLYCNSGRYCTSCWELILHRGYILIIKLDLLPEQGEIPRLRKFICILCMGVYGNDIWGYIYVKCPHYRWHCQSLCECLVLRHAQPALSAFSPNKLKHKLNRLFVIHLTYQSESATRRPDWQPYPQPTNKANSHVFPPSLTNTALRGVMEQIILQHSLSSPYWWTMKLWFVRATLDGD